MQVADLCLQCFQFFFVFIAFDRGGKINIFQFRHLTQRKIFFRRNALIPSFCQSAFNTLYDQAQRISCGGLVTAAVQNVPSCNIACLVHELVIGFHKALILPVLPKVFTVNAPFCRRRFR